MTQATHDLEGKEVKLARNQLETKELNASEPKIKPKGYNNKKHPKRILSDIAGIFAVQIYIYGDFFVLQGQVSPSLDLVMILSHYPLVGSTAYANEED